MDSLLHPGDVGELVWHRLVDEGRVALVILDEDSIEVVGAVEVDKGVAGAGSALLRVFAGEWIFITRVDTDDGEAGDVNTSVHTETTSLSSNGFSLQIVGGVSWLEEGGVDVLNFSHLRLLVEVGVVDDDSETVDEFIT